MAITRKHIISKLIKHRRFYFPGGQPFACGASVRIFRNLGQECRGVTRPDNCMESTKDLQLCLDWYRANNWRKG